MSTKRPNKASHVVARSITLTDSEGTPRIRIGVTDDSAASIRLLGERGQSIDISAEHDGGLHISLRDGSGKIVLALGITSDDRAGISIFDHRSGTATELGSGSGDDGSGHQHYISLRHKGRVHWTTQKRTGGRRKRP